MHVTGADRANTLAPQGERYEQCATINPTRRNMAAFGRCRMFHVGRYPRLTFQKQPLNFLTAHAMLSTLRPVAAISIKACNFYAASVD